MNGTAVRPAVSVAVDLRTSHRSYGILVPNKAIIALPLVASVMTQNDSTVWESLERWSATAFLVAGVLFLASAAVTVVDVAVGAEQLRLQLGQATVGAGWFAGLVGLLGLYRRLADRNRWLVRVGAFFVALGLVGYAIMTVGVLAIFAGVPESDLAPLEPVFLPLMLVGSVLTFPLFGVALLRTEGQSRTVGVLLVTQTVVFVVNAATPTPAEFVLLVLIGLLAINLGVGHLLRTASHPTDNGERDPSRDPTAG